MTTLRSGDRVRIDGDVYTVLEFVRLIDAVTPRYNGDTNPTPAGSQVVKINGGGINQRVLRPGTFTKI